MGCCADAMSAPSAGEHDGDVIEKEVVAEESSGAMVISIVIAGVVMCAVLGAIVCMKRKDRKKEAHLHALEDELAAVKTQHASQRRTRRRQLEEATELDAEEAAEARDVAMPLPAESSHPSGGGLALVAAVATAAAHGHRHSHRHSQRKDAFAKVFHGKSVGPDDFVSACTKDGGDTDAARRLFHLAAEDRSHDAGIDSKDLTHALKWSPEAKKLAKGFAALAELVELAEHKHHHKHRHSLRGAADAAAAGVRASRRSSRRSSRKGGSHRRKHSRSGGHAHHHGSHAKHKRKYSNANKAKLLSQAMAKIDANGDGSLDVDEFLAACAPSNGDREAAARQLFALIDEDRSGAVDVHELGHVLSTDAAARKLADGFDSLHELVSIAQKKKRNRRGTVSQRRPGGSQRKSGRRKKHPGGGEDDGQGMGKRRRSRTMLTESALDRLEKVKDDQHKAKVKAEGDGAKPKPVLTRRSRWGLVKGFVHEMAEEREAQLPPSQRRRKPSLANIALSAVRSRRNEQRRLHQSQNLTTADIAQRAARTIERRQTRARLMQGLGSASGPSITSAAATSRSRGRKNRRGSVGVIALGPMSGLRAASNAARPSLRRGNSMGTRRATMALK